MNPWRLAIRSGIQLTQQQQNFGHPSADAEVKAYWEGIYHMLDRGPTWTPHHTDKLGQTLVRLLAM